MEILQLTPGAGAMFCGNCLRDNALVAALRKMGHRVLMVPLYLPLTLDETDQSAGTPVFFSGINVYLEQKSSWFRRAPRWLHGLFTSRSLLKWAAGRASNTRAENLGELTLSMLRGESGNQSRELEELNDWLLQQSRPDVIFLSNAMLLGMARRLRATLNRPIVCMLQGEDFFLDSLPEPHRSACWEILAARAKDADLFIAPSQYFADSMRTRLELPADRVKVVYNGINLEDYTIAGHARKDPDLPKAGPTTSAPVLGYFARMCREKGLDLLVEAFIGLRERGRIPGLRLSIGGSLGPADGAYVRSLRQRIAAAGLAGEVEFHPNVDRQAKLALLESFSVFSVPARYSEAFGLYVLEAMAAGVPVVQPRTAAFPELLALTGGGVMCEPDNSKLLAEAIERLLMDPKKLRELGMAGRQAVFENFNSDVMARSFLESIKALEACSAL